jgi:hypothetical protein
MSRYGLVLLVLNATFNNISVISWRSVFLIDETGENHLPDASHRHLAFNNRHSLTIGTNVFT